MKNIVIIRGPQGSGKSSLVRRLGLEGHHLSFDKVREVVAGDTINIDGMMTIPQQHNVLVWRSEEHTSELQSLMRISYAVFCLKKNTNTQTLTSTSTNHNVH